MPNKKKVHQSEQGEAIMGTMETMAMGKEIKLTLSKQTWTTQPSGDQLEHVLKLTINMNDEERAEIEDLFRNNWNCYCILGGLERPKQLPLGDTSDDESHGGE